MNDHSDQVDRFGEFDETLHDDPPIGRADVPPEPHLPSAARRFVAEQRVMHGLLRALHTADASTREARVASILARIDAAAPAVRRRPWWLVAAAALLLATFGVWLQLPAELPTAEAAMARASAELLRDVDRRFRLEFSLTGARGRDVERELLLVTRPGKRFRLDGRLGPREQPLRIGSDGSEIWVVALDGAFRRAGPLAERERLLRGLGDLLDLGYVDLEELLQRLPGDLELAVVGRTRGADGRELLQLQGSRRGRFAVLSTASLLVDEASGMVVRLEGETETPGGASRRVLLEYLGEEPPGLVDYRRPW